MVVFLAAISTAAANDRVHKNVGNENKNAQVEQSVADVEQTVSSLERKVAQQAANDLAICAALKIECEQVKLTLPTTPAPSDPPPPCIDYAPGMLLIDGSVIESINEDTATLTLPINVEQKVGTKLCQELPAVAAVEDP